MVLALSACGEPTVVEIGGPAEKPPSGTTPTTPTQGDLPLCVNEFGASGEGFVDETGASPDWVELHNPTGEDVWLLGWYLTDDPDEPLKHPIDGSLWVPAYGYLVFSADGLPDLGPTHLPFRLSALGEAVGLFHVDGDGEIFSYGAVVSDFSWARTPDCCDDPGTCFEQVYLGTPGASNGR